MTVKEKFEELAARKRAELEGSFERGDIAEPISLTAILVSAGISAALSAGTYLLSRALAPKPPKLELGRLSGPLQIQNSEQGIIIPEIYGAGPTASVVTGSDPTYQNLTNMTSGANGSITKTSGANGTYNAGASHNVAVNSGDDAFIQVVPSGGWAGCGFYTTASPTGSGGDPGCLYGVQWGLDNSVWWIVNGQRAAFSTWSVGDTFRVELRSGRFRLFKNSAELFPPNPVSPSYPLYMGVTAYSTGAGVSNAKIKINAIGDTPNAGRGGIKVPAIIVWTSGIRKHVTTTQQQTGGGKGGGGGTQTVENITYDIDLGLMWSRGPVRLIREYGNADVLIDQMLQSSLASGIYDSGVGADPTYDPLLPPDPTLNYLAAFNRVNEDISYDGDGIGSGTIQGGGSLFSVYQGTATQDPDPTIEADIDGKYGAGSTPAYRNHSMIVHKNFYLTRWSGIVPNFTAVWEHTTLLNLSQIFGSLCERVNVKAATNDYNFSALSGIQPRGMLLAGRLFTPAEVIGSPEIQTVYNYFVTEAEGQIIGYVEGGEPSVTIADTEVGWLDQEGEDLDILPEVNSVLASEITLARQVEVKYIDPDKEWEPNTQHTIRQITDGVSTDVLEVQLALLSEEARAVSQRKLYKDYVAGTAHKFTLPWTYLYLYPGYKIIINRAEGFTHTIKLTSITGGIGLLNCEGVAIEPAAFTQPAVGIIDPGFIPPQQVPAMTILQLLDTPLLRDGDETNNNGIGFYAAGTPRTGVNQVWQGFALYINRNGTWELRGNGNLPAVVGVIVNATGLSSDTSVIDRVGKFTVDLYGTTATLASVSEADLRTIVNVNLALVGSMVIQFATATQVAGFPNRWELTTLLNGRRGTEWAITETFTNGRFVLINEAVKFIPMDVADIGNNASYRAVTAGQSLGDAATVSFAWTGETLKPLAPVNLRETQNSQGDRFSQWTRRSRYAGGMIPRSDVPLGEELEMYDVEFLTTANVLKRTMRVIPGGAQAAVLRPTAPIMAPYITGNNVTPTNAAIGVVAYSDQRLGSNGSWVEATLHITTFGKAGIELRIPNELTTEPSMYYSLRFSNIGTGGGATFEIRRNGALQFTSATYPGLRVARVRIVVIGSEVRFYWDYLGPGSIPLHVTSLPAELPLVPTFFPLTNCKVTNTFIGSNIDDPSVIYSAAQQSADGFTPLVSQIKQRVYQISSIVGRGRHIERTF